MRFSSKLFILAVIGMFCLLGTSSAQLSYPSPVVLANGNYTFTEWANTNAAGTYPANMIFQKTATQDPGYLVEPTVNYTAAYNLSSGARFIGKGNDGISMINTSSSGFNGAIILALNTTNRVNINVSWLTKLMAIGARNYGFALQYKVGSNGTWTLLDSTYSSTDYASVPNSKSNTCLLPYDAENQPIVYLRWKYYYKYGSGTRPEIALDDVSVTSESNAGSPVALSIADPMPSKPMINIPFSLVVKPIDENGNNKAVKINTVVQLSVVNGSGKFSSSSVLTKTIPAGQSSITFDNLMFSDTGTKIIRVTRISGIVLNYGEKTVSFLQCPYLAIFKNVYSKGHVNSLITPFTVEATNIQGGINTDFNYPVTLVKKSGTGNILGTSTKTAVNGIATFDDITFDQAGNYEVEASSPAFYISYKANFDIKPAPTFTELKVPQYGIGNANSQDNSGSRMMSFALIQIDNLHPNTEYRYTTRGRESNYTGNFQTDWGAGNNMHYDYKTNSYTYTSQVSNNMTYDPSKPYELYSSFKTDNNGSAKVWLNITYTANASFKAGNLVYWKVNLGNENGTLVTRWKTANYTRSMIFGSTNYQATGIVEPKTKHNNRNFILYYNDANDQMPLSIGMIQGAGNTFADASTGALQAPAWYNDIDGKNGATAAFIPNNIIAADGTTTSPTSIKKIEIYSFDGTLLKTYTDDDGVWAGVSTNSPAGGKTAPIYYELPSIDVYSPAKYTTTNICNADNSMNVEWLSRGVTNFDIAISKDNGTTWESADIQNIQATEITDATQYTATIKIPRAKYYNSTLMIKVTSIEHNYVSDLSGKFNIYDTPEFTNASGDGIYCKGESAQLSIAASGTDLKYQWYKDGIIINNAVSPTLNLDDLDFNNSGVYTCQAYNTSLVCNSATSKELLVYVLGHTSITNQPKNAYAALNGSATFSFDAHTVGQPYDYKPQIQWYKDNQPLSDNTRISGSNANILTISSITAADASNNYYAKIIGRCGDTTTVPVTLSVIDIAIIDQPKSIEICEGSKFKLSINVRSNLELSYQWYKDNIALANNDRCSGANTDTLTIKNTTPSDGGNYYVIVTENTSGHTVISSNAQITVDPKPVIISQVPEATTISALINSSFTLTVNSDPSIPCSYQWYKDDARIDGAVYNSLTQNIVSKIQAGTYYCILSDSCGKVQSKEYVITVADNFGNTTAVNDINPQEDLAMSLVTPNPATDYINFNYNLVNESHISISLVDITGRNLALVFDGFGAKGLNPVHFDITGLNLNSGVYYLTLKSNNSIKVQKVIINK